MSFIKKQKRFQASTSRNLAFTSEAVLRERLPKVIAPGGQVRVGIGADELVDIVLCREALRRATDVDLVLILVDADIVDTHCRGEPEVREIRCAEVGRET